MDFSLLFWILCSCYLAGWLLCSFSFFKNHRRLHRFGEHILFLGVGIQLFYFIANLLSPDGASFTTLSGIFFFCSLFVILIYFFLDHYFSNDILEIIFPPVTVVFLFLGNLTSERFLVARHFLEQSPSFGKIMLYVHGSTTLLGYLLFGLACITSVYFLHQENLIKTKKLHLTFEKTPSLGFLGGLSYKVNTMGFLLLTVGILFGIAMRFVVQNGYPTLTLRQLLTVSTWLIYAAFLLDCFIRGIRGKATAIWSITGFTCAVISFLYEIASLVHIIPES